MKATYPFPVVNKQNLLIQSDLIDMYMVRANIPL